MTVRNQHLEIAFTLCARASFFGGFRLTPIVLQRLCADTQRTG